MCNSVDNEAAVRAVEVSYDAAWNEGDVTSILDLLTDDVVITNPSGETTAGREEVGSSFTAIMNGPARGSTHTSEVVAVHFVIPEVAIVDGVATINGFGTSSEPLRHNYTDVLVNTPDGWRIDQVRAYFFMPRPEL